MQQVFSKDANEVLRSIRTADYYCAEGAIIRSSTRALSHQLGWRYSRTERALDELSRLKRVRKIKCGSYKEVKLKQDREDDLRQIAEQIAESLVSETQKKVFLLLAEHKKPFSNPEIAKLLDCQARIAEKATRALTQKKHLKRLDTKKDGRNLYALPQYADQCSQSDFTAEDQILDALANAEAPLLVHEIAQASGVEMDVVSGHISFLRNAGYVQVVGEDAGRNLWALTPKGSE